TTWYLHLSRILVKVGQRVSQGHVIGRVGATGVATGPHLDYRIQDDRGRFINPQRQLALPSDKPVDPRRMPEFEEVRDKYLEQLEGLPENQKDSSRISVAG
ncbi:MAG TPA: M23 family metallopeptidase, partial [Acidobacteriota bacterium]|nr:M23 family metallopeptidase [Acidobacteriota bacterium]